VAALSPVSALRLQGVAEVSVYVANRYARGLRRVPLKALVKESEEIESGRYKRASSGECGQYFATQLLRVSELAGAAHRQNERRLADTLLLNDAAN